MILEIRTFDGWRKIRAARHGPLAVHRVWLDGAPRRSDRWQISHIASGRALWFGFCCRKSAEELVEALRKFNWNVGALRNKKTYEIADLPKSIRADMINARGIVNDWPNPCERCKKAATNAR